MGGYLARHRLKIWAKDGSRTSTIWDTGGVAVIEQIDHALMGSTEKCQAPAFLPIQAIGAREADELSVREQLPKFARLWGRLTVDLTSAGG